MGCLPERKAQSIFVTATLVKKNGKKRKIVIENRPEFAVVKLNGSREQFPIAWEAIYDIAMQHHERNLQLEAQAVQLHKTSKGKKV